jgi:large subunit ribosomal protein L32
MPVPKQKKGRASTRARRANHIVEAPARSVCSQCHEPKLPHRVCPSCGYYDGKEIVDTE